MDEATKTRIANQIRTLGSGELMRAMTALGLRPQLSAAQSSKMQLIASELRRREESAKHYGLR